MNITNGSEDLHLLNDSNSLWGLFGADLDSDPNLPVTDDIDGGARDASTPDIGADEEGASSTTVKYRSIGGPPDYTTGTIDTTDGSPVVTGPGTGWQTANRGRGDRIDINGTDYAILSVDSNMQLTLTTPVSGNFSGISHTISRQFDTLQEWETCISGGGGCVYFPVAGGDLVADHRSEVGIAYDDGASFAQVLILGSTTDANHTITLTVDGVNRHLGRAGTGVVLDLGSDC